MLPAKKKDNLSHEDEFDLLLQESYALLKRIAQKKLERNKNVTLSATELVHEFYLKMGQKPGMKIEDSGHFISLASQCMRWLMMDYAKSKKREKRGGGEFRVSFDETLHGKSSEVSLTDLTEAMEKLGKISPRTARVAECRYILGMDYQEMENVLNLSSGTLKRECGFAKAFLAKELFA